jgi:hypothetical protein
MLWKIKDYSSGIAVRIAMSKRSGFSSSEEGAAKYGRHHAELLQEY